MKKVMAILTMIVFVAGPALAADKAFQKADKNKDGKITSQEYLNATSKAFDELDKNRDGVLTKEEIQANDKIDADKLIRETDANRDGKILKKEYQKAAKQRFHSMDKNKIGHIDYNEWPSDRSDLYSPFNLFSF